MTVRSYLYVPGDRVDRLEKAVDRGADALIADLEDAVAPSSKDAARESVSEWIARFPEERGSPQIWVRVNSGQRMKDDVAAVAKSGLTGVYVPKVESPEALLELPAHLGVAALIESARGVYAAKEIAEHVSHLALGEADLTADLGITPSEGAPELMSIRTQIVLASAAAGIAPPVGPVSTDFKDLDALRHSTEALKRMGFRGRAAIHPAQVPIINEVFTPTDEEVESAKKVLALYEEAMANGSGAIADENGRMIDEAVARAARQTLELASTDR
jgi:citrate lyase subunit beta/citryl-CoA lyase